MVVISKRGYSIRQAAEYIGKSVAWLRQKRTRGPDDPGDPGPMWVYVEGGSVTYFREDLDAWLYGLSACAPQADKRSHERMLLARQAKEAKRLTTAKGSQ